MLLYFCHITAPAYDVASGRNMAYCTTWSGSISFAYQYVGWWGMVCLVQSVPVLGYILGLLAPPGPVWGSILVQVEVVLGNSYIVVSYGVHVQCVVPVCRCNHYGLHFHVQVHRVCFIFHFYKHELLIFGFHMVKFFLR